MSELSTSKPEPHAARQKWHYDSYFLSQLERLNLRQTTHMGPKTEKIAQVTSKNKQPKEKAVDEINQESELKIRKRNEVINRINELAASIGISVTIIENSKIAA